MRHLTALRWLFVGSLAILIASPLPLSASAITYTDRTLWELSTPGFVNIDFEGITSTFQSFNTSDGLTVNGVQFIGLALTPSSPYQLWVVNPAGTGAEDFGSGSYLKGPMFSSGVPDRQIRVNLPPNIDSFGVDLMTTGSTPQSFAIYVWSGQSPVGGWSVSTVPGNRTFFGLNAGAPITMIEFMLDTGVTYQTYPLLDNFAFGVAAPLSAGTGGSSGEQTDPMGAEVSEGTTLLLVAAGLLVVQRLRRQPAVPLG